MSSKTKELLETFIRNYENKKTDKHFSLVKISVDSTEGIEIFYLINKPDKIELISAEQSNTSYSTEFDIGIKLTEETLTKLSIGAYSPLTAAGRANVHEPAPLDFELPPGKQFSMELYHAIIQFIQRFFNPFVPEKIFIDPNNTRKVHGADVVALFAGEGFRSGFYSVKKGDRLNEPSDTNPFPQAFIILSGEGKAKIGSIVTDLLPNQAIYVPPNSEHTIWTEKDEPVTLIWFAWGKGA